MRILKATPQIGDTFNTTVYRKWWQFWKPKSWQIRVPDRRETSDEFEEENTEVGAGKLYRALEESMKK